MAEDATTVDLLSNGRFDLGVGKGYRVNEFTGFGIPRQTRDAQLEEGAGGHSKSLDRADLLV